MKSRVTALQLRPLKKIPPVAGHPDCVGHPAWLVLFWGHEVLLLMNRPGDAPPVWVNSFLRFRDVSSGNAGAEPHQRRLGRSDPGGRGAFQGISALQLGLP